MSPGGQGRAPPGAPLIPVAAAQPSWGLRGQRVPGVSPAPAQLGAGAGQTQATGKEAETLLGSLGPGLWAHAQCLLERGRGTPPQGPSNSAGRQGPRGQKHTLTHPRTRSLPHPSRHLGQLPRKGAGSGLAPQLAFKFHSAPSGSRPRKVLFTCSLPVARAGWQLALASAGGSWWGEGGWEEVGFLLTLGGRPRGPARSLRGPAGGRTAGAPPPCWGPGGLWPQGPKPISRHRPRKMVTGRREDRAAEGPAASVPAETRQPPGSCGHTWGSRGLALQLNQAEESKRRGSRPQAWETSLSRLIRPGPQRTIPPGQHSATRQQGVDEQLINEPFPFLCSV